jgi:predicted porin
VHAHAVSNKGQVENMKGIRVAAASAAVMILGGGAAFAADLGTMPTKAAVLKADAACTSIVDFFTTACQVAAYGVRFYGTIDIGYGYQTNGAPFDKLYGPGVTYFPNKANNGGKWLLSPNALSASNIGVQIKESLGGGWSFIGQLETAFDPFSLDLNNGVGSVHENVGIPYANQTSSGDSSMQGKFYNSQGYAGFSHDTWGTLTFGRQTTLMADSIRSYDPMGGAYAFSLIGYFGATGGGGNTENGRDTTAVKYRLNYGDYRLGLYGQFGGYDEGNGARGSFYGSLGADYKIGPGVLSLDAIGGFTKDSINESLSGSAQAVPAVTPALTVTLSDNTNVMVLAKYTLDKLKLYAGYEWMQFANPSDPMTTAFTDTAGYVIAPGSIANTTYNKDKVLQVVWAGARYSLTDSVDLVGAYYHYDQNQYASTAGNVNGCAVTSGSNGACAGTQDVASFLVDWKFAPKWDTYIGTMYTKLNGGLDSGLLAKDNWATTAGVRFRW